MFRSETITPKEAGISPERILRFLDRLEEKKVPMHGFQFIFRDRLLSEGYYAPYTKTTLHRMFSISKSVTSLCIGFLEKEGKLSLSDRIVTYFPDRLPADLHPWIGEMTIRDMLMMRTCHASTTYKIDMTKDWVQSFFITPPTHQPGTVFHYDTSAAHVLCALVECLSGMPIWDYFRKKLATLELSDESYFLTDPFGVSLGGSGLVCLPEDLRKIAYFMMHKGILDGEALLSPSYLEAATSCLTATLVTAPLPSEACGYGYQIWQNQRGGYTFYGMGGQLMIFLPRQDFVCITTADTQGMAGGNQLIYDALYEEILPYLGKDSEASSASMERLSKKLAGLSIPPLEAPQSDVSPAHLGADYVKDHPHCIYELQENPQGFTKVELCFEKNAAGLVSGRITFHMGSFPYPLEFGFGHMALGIFPKYNQKYASSAVWLDTSTLYVKFHVIDAYVGSVHVQIHFSGEQVTLFLKKQEESLFTEFRGHLTGTRTMP